MKKKATMPASAAVPSAVGSVLEISPQTLTVTLLTLPVVSCAISSPVFWQTGM